MPLMMQMREHISKLMHIQPFFVEDTEAEDSIHWLLF